MVEGVQQGPLLVGTFFPTHRGRPPNRRQNSPNPNRGPAQGGQTPQPAGPNGPNRSPKWPLRRRYPIHN